MHIKTVMHIKTWCCWDLLDMTQREQVKPRHNAVRSHIQELP